MDKKENNNSIIIIVLIVIIVGLVGYICYDKLSKEDNTSNSTETNNQTNNQSNSAENTNVEQNTSNADINYSFDASLTENVEVVSKSNETIKIEDILNNYSNSTEIKEQILNTTNNNYKSNLEEITFSNAYGQNDKAYISNNQIIVETTENIEDTTVESDKKSFTTKYAISNLGNIKSFMAYNADDEDDGVIVFALNDSNELYRIYIAPVSKENITKIKKYSDVSSFDLIANPIKGYDMYFISIDGNTYNSDYYMILK